MQPWIIELGLAALSVGGWFAVYGLMLLVTRPRGITPAPAGQDLGPEPPAVASLVGNGWDLTEDAAEATLLDLGARDIVEFRQPADDPMHTTIHILQSNPTGLLPYERRVFDRIAGLAAGGVVPLTALTFRDQKKAQSWWKQLRAEVIADARSRGVSQRRFGPTHVGILVAGAAVAALGIALAMAHNVARGDEEDPIGTVIGFGIVSFLVLSGLASRNVGERDTAAGREVAARWLGVKKWLRAHEAFAELPPSAVAVWDRYLGYGAALGATRMASAVIDMGMGNRRRVWSSHGGTWHRVRVRYPRLWPRYGRPATILVLRAVFALAAGYALVRWWRPLIAELAAMDLGDRVRALADPVQLIGFAAGVALLAYGGYTVIRVIIDAIAPAHVTGQVLWIQVWRQHSGGEDSPPRPWLHYLAIDDGRSDRTTAWGLPSESAHRCETGDTVTAKIRRWSRRIVEITLVERGSDGHRTDTTHADADMDKLVSTMLGEDASAAPSRPTIATGSLLTAEEVSQALGFPVTLVETQMPGPVSMVHFSTTDRNRAVLMLQLMSGTMANLAWRMNSKGQQLTGVGDSAWIHGERAAARRGDTIVLLHLMKEGRNQAVQLPTLLRQAVSRLPSPRDPEGVPARP